MCKLFAITGITPATAKKASQLLYAAQPRLNERDKDGFGYVAYNARENAFWGERWLKPKDVFSVRGNVKAPADIQEVLEPTSVYNFIGDRGAWISQPTAIVAHARYATNKVCLENVHPFVAETPVGFCALAHNGVVSGDLDLSGSEKCDSAGILNAYLKAGTYRDETSINEALEKVYGSYAVIVLGTLPEYGYIDIFRNEGSDLSASWVKDVGLVWCTSSEIVREAASKLNLEVKGAWTVKAHMLIRLSAKTGKVISKIPFQSSKKTYGYSSTYDYAARQREWARGID